ncbi:protein SRG1-like [Olea europaea var. sylvestris]|uniref:protein SRG1-like n=1 Tax=Olea europaea var. sylvestris TaxID=158386 RepID=UPI000C1CEBA4|nr:protein SRG1-like isoform X3 [Olea europaea var. sylvestris]XP_022871583.1 protein SRG1-like [Olea europaea var. sylvestris]
MAEVEVTQKPVQEMVENGIQFPNEYIWKDANYGVIDAFAPLAEIPVIDIARLNNVEELDKLRSALTSWGCFQAINHGIEFSLLEKIREVGRQFFHLPMMEKQKYAREAGKIDGYGNDMILFENQTLDWFDRLMLLVHPENERKLKFWPENPQSFRAILFEYATRIEQIEEQLLKSMARSLNLEEDCFLKQCGQLKRLAAQFNYYPPCPRPDCVLGLKPHADATTVTILLQDEEIEGLQVMKDDKWFRVPIIPGALLVNVGDQIEIMSNGIFKSPVHRALTNSKKERKTLAMFCASEVGKEIEPVGKLINDNRPRLYKAVRDYHETFIFSYQQGKRAIDAVKM